MSGEINRVPLGLLPLLDMKARGNNPRTLADQVTGTIDLTELYARQAGLITQVGQINAIVGIAFRPDDTTNTVVPENELWYVHGAAAYSLGTMTGAAIIWRGSLAVANTNLPFFWIVGPESAQYGQNDRAYASSWGPFWMGPGYRLGLATSEFTAGTVALDMGLSATVSKFRV